MGLFDSKEEKESKKEKKLQDAMAKYELEELDKKYANAVKDIQSELLGTGMMEFGTLLSGKAEDNVKIAYLNTLIKQNWIIIRQLDEISKSLSN